MTAATPQATPAAPGPQYSLGKTYKPPRNIFAHQIVIWGAGSAHTGRFMRGKKYPPSHPTLTNVPGAAPALSAGYVKYNASYTAVRTARAIHWTVCPPWSALFAPASAVSEPPKSCSAVGPGAFRRKHIVPIGAPNARRDGCGCVCPSFEV